MAAKFFKVQLDTVDFHHPEFQEALSYLGIASRIVQWAGPSGYTVVEYIASKKMLKYLISEYWADEDLFELIEKA